MRSNRDSRRAAYVGKARTELESLAERGVVAGGNAFSPVLVVGSGPTARSSAPSFPEAAAEPFSEVVASALRASLDRLGYAPEDWEWLSTCADDGVPLAPELLYEAVASLGPSTVIAADLAATDALRNALAEDLAALPDIRQAMLAPGRVAIVRGMRVMSLGDFASALEDDGPKQMAWRWLKQLPPLGEPY